MRARLFVAILFGFANPLVGQVPIGTGQEEGETAPVAMPSAEAPSSQLEPALTPPEPLQQNAAAQAGSLPMISPEPPKKEQAAPTPKTPAPRKLPPKRKKAAKAAAKPEAMPLVPLTPITPAYP